MSKQRKKLYLKCVKSGNSDGVTTFKDLDNYNYIIYNSIYIFVDNNFYYMSAFICMLSNDTLLIRNIRILNVDNSKIERMFKIKNILDE
jgi:hypothetical protein